MRAIALRRVKELEVLVVMIIPSIGSSWFGQSAAAGGSV
jgi:hypothetical protein